jgi:hypothetical protein
MNNAEIKKLVPCDCQKHECETCFILAERKKQIEPNASGKWFRYKVPAKDLKRVPLSSR